MGFGMFVLLFTLLKLMRMMVAATVVLAAALILCRLGGARTWRLNLGMLALVPFACLMGYSKIFFTGRLFIFTNYVRGLITEELAVIYFMVTGVLAVRHIRRHRRLRRELCRMQRLERAEYSGLLPKGSRGKIRVYLTEKYCSPFAGGILRPYIVLPKILKEQLSKKEFAAVLCHEMLHIRQGHVLLLHVYAWLRIFWWIHPLLPAAEARLRENVEYSSDEGSVMLGPLDACAYAGVILKTLRMRRQEGFLAAGVTTFSDHSFSVLKKRVERLGKIRENGGAKSCYQKRRQIFAVLSGIAVAAMLGAAWVTAMPRYTRMEEIAAFDEELQPLTYDLEKEGFLASAADEGFCMSSRELQRFAEKYKPQGEYVIFCYGSIMKEPGVGGLGQAARVRVSDASDVALLARREWIDELQVFIMKYLI